MNSKNMKRCLLRSGIAASILLGATLVGTAAAQTVNLTAKSTTALLPDGQNVPMWGLFCNDAGSNGASCVTANPSTTTSTHWAPPVIRVVAGSTLTINLNNTLSFGTGTNNKVPTSLMIVGQVGGGLGDVQQRQTMPSPVHGPQGTTWPGTLGGTNSAAGDAVFTPPAQAARVRSFGTEVAAGAQGTLIWRNLRAGTYLIESGTEPSIQVPMGLYGMVVVTEADDTTGSTPVHQAFGAKFDQERPAAAGRNRSRSECRSRSGGEEREL